MKRKMMRIILTGVCVVCLIACGKSEKDAASDDYQEQFGMNEENADELADALDGSGEVQTGNNENIGTETEITVDERAGLYQSDGSFIPWDDLNIDVETNYSLYTYQIDEKSPYKVFTDNGYNGKLIIPDNITKIGSDAFCDCTSLTSIDLSNTQITEIGMVAFGGCTSLTSIDFPDALTSIEEGAFRGCTSLTSMDLSNTQITSINREAFVDCISLISIDLSNTQITHIGVQAFMGCTSLTKIDLPDTLTKICGLFENCTSLTSIELSNTVTIIYGGTFEDCTSLTNITYTGTMEEWNVIEKQTGWDRNSSIETITCSDGVITLK